MSYPTLAAAVSDLELTGQLIRIREEVDPYLEAAAIQRQIYENKGPALLFERLKGSRFAAVSNLFGTVERGRHLLRHSLPQINALMQLAADPTSVMKHPLKSLALLPWLAHALPKRRALRHLDAFEKIDISDLPQIHFWKKDGGAFITLPQVFTQNPQKPGIMNANMGMYRIQLGGNNYQQNQQIGMHYQIHRTIANHHAYSLAEGKNLPVSIFVGGPPAHTLAAVMPLPEAVSEVLFAGLLASRRFRYCSDDSHVYSLDADFIISGEIDGNTTLPEGPFGDHLGYYSLRHPFPVMKVRQVYARKQAIWPFTVVGRPPQEDTTFGKLIHEITAPVVKREIPGVIALHAVDEAGVHPLMLAVAHERYTPYEQKKPREILTAAHAILGFGQASLAKYLIICAEDRGLHQDIGDTRAFLEYALCRVDWRRDLHFITNTTMDTLDYSGTALNEGSKIVIAAAGEARRRLGRELPAANLREAHGYKDWCLVAPGIIAVSGPAFADYLTTRQQMQELSALIKGGPISVEQFPLIIVTDQAGELAEKYANFLWVTFTRSNPSHDIYGVDASYEHKHWGCHGPLIIDARIKPHHAPQLEEDPLVLRRIKELAAPGKSLHGYL